MTTQIKSRFRTHWEFDYRQSKGWRSNKPGLAIPDVSYSLRDLHEKYSKGTADAIAASSNRYHYDDENAPEDAPLPPQRLGLKDPAEIADYVHRTIKPYVKKVQETVKEKLEASKLKELEKEAAKAAEPTQQATNANATTINDDAKK